MKLIKRLLILQLICLFAFLSSSCKTKQALAEQEKYDQKLSERNEDQSDALVAAGLAGDDAEAILDMMKKMDEDLMNFLKTDPSQDARSEFLSDMMRDRESKVRNSMTPEQYEAYRKALLEKTRKEAIEQGAPSIKPGG